MIIRHLTYVVTFGIGPSILQLNMHGAHMSGLRSTVYGRLPAAGRLLLAAMTLVAVAPSAARSEYQLDTGDVIEVTVIGMPDMRQQAMIDPAGQAAFPVLGRVKAGGIVLSDVQQTIRDLLPSKVFRRRTEDGREYPVVITPDEIAVNVVEYRPVYLNGDVAKPGAQTFRPGMTVRQAIALAGGYDVLRFRAKDPFLESADLQSEYSTLWAEFAKERARLARTRAELGDRDQLDQPDASQLPIPRSLAAQLEKLEAERLLARNLDHRKEVRYLKDAISQTRERISVLANLQREEQEDANADKAEFDQTRQHFQKGVVPTTRVSEARRLSIFSSSRVLQTTVLLGQLERDRQDLDRRLQKTDDQRRFELLGDMQDANLKLDAIRSRLQAVGEKLVYTGVVKSQLARGRGGKPDVAIFRMSGGRPQQHAADEDAALLPGDVVEISLRLEGVTAAPAQ